MPVIETPRDDQLRINDPFQQRILQFDITQSRNYLARTNNLEYQAIGKDIVLSGYRIDNFSFTPTSATFEISEGWVIMDYTCIYLKEPQTIVFPSLTSFDESGLIVIYLSYQWLEVYGENPLRIKATHLAGAQNITQLSPPLGTFTAHTSSPEPWNVATDRVILEC